MVDAGVKGTPTNQEPRMHRRKRGLTPAQQKKRQEKTARRKAEREKRAAEAPPSQMDTLLSYYPEGKREEMRPVLETLLARHRTPPSTEELEEMVRAGSQIPGSLHTYGEIVRLSNLDLTPMGDDPNSQVNLIRELLSLARGIILEQEEQNIPWVDRGCFLHPRIEARVKAIGEALHGLGGYDLMQWFCQCDLLSIPRCWHRELDYAWDGIGDWKA